MPSHPNNEKNLKYVKCSLQFRYHKLMRQSNKSQEINLVKNYLHSEKVSIFFLLFVVPPLFFSSLTALCICTHSEHFHSCSWRRKKKIICWLADWVFMNIEWNIKREKCSRSFFYVKVKLVMTIRLITHVYK